MWKESLGYRDCRVNIIMVGGIGVGGARRGSGCCGDGALEHGCL